MDQNSAVFNEEEIPPFSELVNDLDNQEGVVLYDHMVQKKYSAGETIFEQESPGDVVYIIEQGQVDIIRKQNGEKSKVINLTKGQIVGEMAFLDQGYRWAAAIARTEVSAYALNYRNFKRLRKKHPHVANKLYDALTRILIYRLRKTNRAALDDKK